MDVVTSRLSLSAGSELGGPVDDPLSRDPEGCTSTPDLAAGTETLADPLHETASGIWGLLGLSAISTGDTGCCAGSSTAIPDSYADTRKLWPGSAY